MYCIVQLTNLLLFFIISLVISLFLLFDYSDLMRLFFRTIVILYEFSIQLEVLTYFSIIIITTAIEINLYTVDTLQSASS